MAQAEHLAHWGINVAVLQKTEKTMAELQIDLNMSFEFDRITEAGAALQPLSGPGCVSSSVKRRCLCRPGGTQCFAARYGRQVHAAASNILHVAACAYISHMLSAFTLMGCGWCAICTSCTTTRFHQTMSHFPPSWDCQT